MSKNKRKNNADKQEDLSPDKPIKMTGMSFSSPAALYVLLHSIAKPVDLFLLLDEVERKTIRTKLREPTRNQRVAVVGGVRNLTKLGSKPDPKLCVVVYDTPEVLEQFKSSIRVIDAVKGNDGTYEIRSLKPNDVVNRILGSGYGLPIGPKKIAKALSAFTAVVPIMTDKFNPQEAIETLINSVRESHREILREGIFRFVAGLTNRRTFSSVRRTAINRIVDGVNVVQYKQLFANVQRWIEAEGEGRRTSAAYQLIARKKVVKPALAAARVNAHMGMLMALTRIIPPSRNMRFEGWEYKPKKGD